MVFGTCAATTASVEAACRSLTVDKRRDLALPTDGPPNRTTVTAKIRKQAVMIRVGKVMVGSSDWVEIGRGRPRIVATAFTPVSRFSWFSRPEERRVGESGAVRVD